MSTTALTNANIVTMDDSHPRAEAAFVSDGRIMAVGSSEKIRSLISSHPETHIIDCGGKTVVPGFIDGHAHFELTCCALTHALSVTTPPHETLESIAAAIHERAEQTPPGEWILARGSFNMYARIEERRLFTRQELDAISETHPVVVYSSLHVNMLNTYALKELGLWDQEPPKGVVVHYAEDGTPTGAVTEIWDMVPGYTVEKVKEAIRARSNDLFVQNGVTSIHNLPYSKEDILAVQEMQKQGELPIRFRMFYHVPHQIELDALLSMGLKPGFGNEMLRYGGVKIFADGVGHDGYGNRVWDMKWETDELTEFICKVHEAGQQIWIHICCQPSIHVLADAFEEAFRRHPAPHRHRIEHAADYLNNDADMKRLRDLGIGIVTTPQFIYAQGDILSLPNSQRFPRPFQLKTLVEHGFEIIGSSDTTGTVPDGITPLFNIASAVTRRTRSGNYYLPEEALSVQDALRLFTIWPARAVWEDHEKGSITVGKLGDFAILSQDPFSIDHDDLFDIRVDTTIFNGDIVWQRD